MSNIELRGAAIDAAAESATHHDSGTPPTGICNERDAAGNAAQSAPHHSRTEQEHADSVARSGEPAPAREPVHNDWSKAKAKVLAKYPAAQYEAMQGYLPPYGHIVWINHKRDAPSDRGYGLSNATSEQEAWLEAARNLPAPAREPAVEEVNAAKKEGCFITAVGSYYQNVVGLDVALRHAGELDRLRAERAQELHIVFDGPPSHQSGRFVEVETADGKSVSVGRWEQRGDYWHLILGERK